MNKEEMICKNCKYHYIEEIIFDYPQSCCNKRKVVIEEWFNCNDFEYSDRYIKQLQQENQKYKEVIDKAIEFTNKNWGTWCTHHIEYMTELQNILKEGKK